MNDYSGSPHVLALIIKGLIEKGYIVDLYTSSKHGGFLSGITGVNYHTVFYRFTRFRLLTLLLYILAQFRYFLVVFKYLFNRNITIYVNTILPFGAAIGASLTKKHLIYHVHEKPVNLNIINRIALFVLYKFSKTSIYVSKYLFEQYNLVHQKNIVYNALDPSFVFLASKHIKIYQRPFNILMVCSLKKYKGVDIFIKLAFQLPQYSFSLVLNATIEQISTYFKGIELPGNLNIHSVQKDLFPFYSSASLVVNLSVPDLWIETFGLTALEAMTYSIPVIVPNLGGIAEIVDDGIQGFKVDSRNFDLLIERIQEIFKDEQKYFWMSSKAKEKADFFSYSKMINSIDSIINRI